jgi:formylglycine-generating enzyme required for sulfatase activity
MGNNPSNFAGCDDCPVENVSWIDVQQYIAKLNSQTDKNYRLPTEAEWEFSARGGKCSKGYTYSGSNDLNAVAWNTDNSESKTHTVGGKQANELGLYDMTGNVWEWCSDWYGSYNSYKETNPTGASSGQLRELRGGCWYLDANYCRSSDRSSFSPDSRYSINGFRLVLPIAQKDPLNHEVIFVEGGTFQMGSSSGDDDEKPVHSVTLSSFNIGKYEVTQAQWKAVMGSNPSNFSGCDNCPVESVSWNDVQDFFRKLNAQTGKNYRLPTEAEWEYSAKGGKQSRGYTYSGSNDLGAVAWYTENSGSKTHAVGGKQANELGIYDMTGNVMEWCSDRYGIYSSYSETNPTGASSGQYHVLRGGNWDRNANHCRAACRFSNYSDGRYSHRGLRLVLPAGNLTESKATNDLDSDAKVICEFMSQLFEAQQESDLDKILLLQKQLEPFLVEIEKRYPKGSDDGKKMEILIKPCLIRY